MKNVLATCVNWLRRLVGKVIQPVPAADAPVDVAEMLTTNTVWLERFLHQLVTQVVVHRKINITQADVVMLLSSVAGLVLARRWQAT